MTWEMRDPGGSAILDRVVVRIRALANAQWHGIRSFRGALQWRRAAKRLYRQFVNEGDTVFDVGANVGNRVAILRSIGAKVVAIDPQPQCVERLKADWVGDQMVEVVAAGLAAHEGRRTLRVASESTISSMSEDWIAAVRESGRFNSYCWGAPIEVPVTTLDRIIDEFGPPAFIKIDVEGFEREVISGLSTPVAGLSFEFAAERSVQANECIELVDALGAYRFAFSREESFVLGPWRSAKDIRTELAALSGPLPWGDVYAARMDRRTPSPSPPEGVE